MNAEARFRVSESESIDTMKLTQLFPIVPLLSVCALLATPSTGWTKHKKASVYVDRDGDGHYNKKKVEIPHHRYSHGTPYYGSSHYRHSYPHYGYGYGYGPSVSLSVSRSYAPRYVEPSYSDGLAVDVQRELRRRGYYRGSIDGDVGPGTRSAIRAYQYDRGLSATGRIDRSLLRSLGIG